MKYITLFIFLTILLLSAINAQVSITGSDWESQLQIGKQITTFNDRTTTSVDIGAPGSNSWDFSNLIANDEFVTESKDYASSPYASDFPGAEYASHYEGTFEGVFSSTWVYNTIGDFMISHGTGTVANSQAGDIKTLITFENGWSQYKLPVEYQGTWSYSGSQTIATTITIPVIGDQTTTIVQQRTSEYVVDAYGTVTMPDGKTLNALRIREETHLVGDNVDATSVGYRIITKTGEAVSISLAGGVTANSGVVEISAISWSTGDGEGIDLVDIVNGPTGLGALIGANSITLNWADNSDNENGFKVERNVVGTLGKTSGVEEYVEIADLPANTSSYEDETAEAGVEYSYRISAYNDDTTSVYSNEITAMIEASVDVINAPSTLNAEAGENSITLSWLDNADNEIGFKIERAEGGSGQFSELAEVAAEATTYEDTNVQVGIQYTYRIYAYNNETTSELSNEASATIAVTDIEEISGLPNEYSLNQNYPNPFNPSTNIQFSLPQSENVVLKIFNSLGQEVAELVNQNLGAGNYNFDFIASNLTSGIYFYSLRAGSFFEIKKMILIK